MTDLERAFEDCWERLSAGQSTLEACLERYPQHAETLGPMLQAARALDQGSQIMAPSHARARGRARLQAHMAAHPRRRRTRPGWRQLLAPTRWAPALAALLLTLGVGTAAAQAAGPSDLLYPWKLASQSVWLAFSPDMPATASAIASRRAQDLLGTTAGSPARQAALDAYINWIEMMQAQGLLTPEALAGLKLQGDRLEAAGLRVPALEAILSSWPDLAPPPTTTPTPAPDSPLPDPSLPGLPTPDLPTPELPLPTLPSP